MSVIDLVFDFIYDLFGEIPWLGGLRSAQFGAAFAKWIVGLLATVLVIYLLKGQNSPAAIIFSIVALGFLIAAFIQMRAVIRKGRADLLEEEQQRLSGSSES